MLLDEIIRRNLYLNGHRDRADDLIRKGRVYNDISQDLLEFLEQNYPEDSFHFSIDRKLEDGHDIYAANDFGILGKFYKLFTGKSVREVIEEPEAEERRQHLFELYFRIKKRTIMGHDKVASLVYTTMLTPNGNGNHEEACIFLAGHDYTPYIAAYVQRRQELFDLDKCNRFLHYRFRMPTVFRGKHACEPVIMTQESPST